jgi:hypothetical protein
MAAWRRNTSDREASSRSRPSGGITVVSPLREPPHIPAMPRSLLPPRDFIDVSCPTDWYPTGYPSGQARNDENLRGDATAGQEATSTSSCWSTACAFEDSESAARAVPLLGDRLSANWIHGLGLCRCRLAGGSHFSPLSTLYARFCPRRRLPRRSGTPATTSSRDTTPAYSKSPPSRRASATRGRVIRQDRSLSSKSRAVVCSLPTNPPESSTATAR